MTNEIMIPESSINEVVASYADIPFGNSDFQDKMFIANAQLTPCRTFRAVCLKLSDRINALQDAYYTLKREDIDIAEMREKLADDVLGKYPRQRVEIDLEQKQSQHRNTQKMVDDAIHEANFLYQLWKELPHPTREEFEAEEQEHFEKSLRRQALGVTGALESLANMGLVIGEKGELKKLPEGL